MNRRKLPEGKFAAWKIGKREVPQGLAKVLIRLEVPGAAVRCLPRDNDGKFRVSRARVVSICALEYDGPSGTYNANEDRQYRWSLNCFCNSPDKRCRYVVGKVMKPKKPFNDDRSSTCGSGIHAFLTMREALTYASEY